MRRHSPLQQLNEAKQIAKDHHMLVVEKDGRYLLFRLMRPHNVFVGQRSSPEALRQFVAKCTNCH